MLIFLLCGCSGSDTPVEPASVPALTGLTQASPPAGPPSESHGLWGFWWIYVDPDNSEWEIIPSRDPVMHANIRRFLEDGLPCDDCLSIEGIAPGPDDTKLVDIQISHPFPDNDTFTGFDVRAIAMWNGNEVWPESGLRTQDPDGTDGLVLNADGYTTLFNPTDYPEGSSIPLFTYSKGSMATYTAPDSTLNPWLDYYTDEDRHMFRAGESVTRTWQIRFPTGGPFVLGYAVDACWELPNPNPPVNIPDDFPLTANRPEAYQVEIFLAQNLGAEVGSESEVRVRVWDWYMNDCATNAHVECPDLWEGTKSSFMSASGPQSVTFYIPIVNETGATNGAYRSLVTIDDTCPGQPDFDCNSYRFFDIQVGDENHAPIAAAEAEQYTAYMGEAIMFHSLATDPDGVDDIEEYWWDFENDGIWDWPAKDTPWPFNQAGIYYVDHRVIDFGGLEDDLEPDELIVIEIFDPCCDNPPVADGEALQTSVLVGDYITLNSYSYDPDGSECIDELGWDYDGDPEIDDYGWQIIISYNEPGIYHIQHQIIDTCGLEDWLDEPIVVEVAPDCCEEPPVPIIWNPPNDVLTDVETYLYSDSFDPESPACPVFESWDFDNDGEFDDAEGPIVSTSWDEVGVYEIGLKVVDDCDLVSTTTTEITVHVGVTRPEDDLYRTPGTKYSYVSADIPASEAAAYVDVTDLDGPWDFTGLTLSDEGNYTAFIPTDHPEVEPWVDDFTQSIDHFYKTEGIFNIISEAFYIGETYITSTPSLLWIGIHEDSTIGSITLSPKPTHEYPYWIFSEIDYIYGFPPIFEFTYNLKGYTEGVVTVPYAGISQFALITRYELGIDSPALTGSTLVYEWVLDDGTVVAKVAAINMDAEINYDPDTLEITGTATYNALSDITPY